ncbi:MAG TPA: hypothetical protein VNA22_03835 [Pyrinomonadaceae bacterium]|nr:hypothetical protein [Pyrinomonadaceae bacterium]
MFEDLIIEFRGDHIYIRHDDNFDISPETMNRFWTFVAEQCARFECSSLLIEGTAPKREMDTVSAFSSGVQASTVAPHLWMALCFHNYEPDEVSEMFRQAARNRGANVRFFSDCAKALNWLRANNPHFD